MCDKRGDRLNPSEERLLRQVYPSWLEEDGEPSSQAFYPWRDRDKGCLSVDRESLTSAEASFALFTSLLPNGFGQPSAGVWLVLYSQVIGFGLSAWEDPRLADPQGPANPAHALIEFSDTPKSSWKSIGRKLKLKARELGKQYPPQAPTTPASAA